MKDAYLDLGWSIFPVKGKIPLTKDGFKSASNDPEIIDAIFKPHNGCNIGVATGDVSGIFVLDIDVKKGAGGDESLKLLINEFGPLPETAFCKTWSGGWHYYFKQPHDVPVGCKTNLRAGIDIRGNGGYVVAPPSVINGKPYEWSKSPSETMIAEAPEWLLSLLNESKPTVDLSNGDDNITKNRNDSLMHIGVGLRKLGFNGNRILEHLIHINTTRCKPPLAEKEVRKIAESVSRYESKPETWQPLTDVYNAKFFTELHGENVRYCDSLGGWFIWKNGKWIKDDSFEIINLAIDTLHKMREQAINKEDKDLMKHAIKSESDSKIKSMLSLARANGVAVNSELFDQNKFLVNCQNGSLDLLSMEFSDHDRLDYCTKMTNVNYIPKAKSPRWLQFLDEIFVGDKDLINFMQKAIGYSLSGSMQEQCIFILYGTGMNGKSTLLKHVFNVIGDYAINTPATALMEKRNEGIPNDIARLKDARFVTAAESGKNKALAEAQIKQLTGDDPISARFLHKEYFDFFATFKIFLATNHKPVIKGTDKGIWRRIMMVPFSRVISEDKRDPNLDAKLKAEYEGIFAWCVEGFKKWQDEGLKTPAAIDELKEEYQQDQDIVGQFIEECCFVESYAQVLSSTLMHEFQDWSKDQGYKFFKRNELHDYLKNQGYYRDRQSVGDYKGKYFWYGIGLKSKNSDISDTE